MKPRRESVITTGNVAMAQGVATMPTWASVLMALVGAVPGVFALFGSATWIGRISTRLGTVERELRDLKDIKAEVATIAERTLNTAKILEGQAGDLRRITDHFLDESRSFAKAIVRSEASQRS